MSLRFTIALGAYLVCGILWARHNRMRPALLKSGAPDLLIILLWPLQFYNIWFRSFWHPERFTVHVSPREKVRPEDYMTSQVKAFSSWFNALIYALQMAEDSRNDVVIFDRARFDKVFGRLMRRMYSVEPSGEVAIASRFPGKRIIRKASRIEQSTLGGRA